MKEIVFMLEEPSARKMIEGLWPELVKTIVGEEPAVRFIVFQGKQD